MRLPGVKAGAARVRNGSKAVIGAALERHLYRQHGYADRGAERGAVEGNAAPHFSLSGHAYFDAAAVPYFGSREEREALETRERRAIDAAYAPREQPGETGREGPAMGGPFEPAEDDRSVRAAREGE